MTVKIILGIDIGFGDCKITLGTSAGEIQKQFKFPSSVGITQKNPHVNDTRIYDFKAHDYYVGEDALLLPSENLIDITDYKNLEHYAPLLLRHALFLLGDITPDIIVSGLSKAQIENSGHFKAGLSNFTVSSKEFTFPELYILPQGAGSKLTIDKYGSDFPNLQDEFLGKTSFVGCDIGFSTIDMFLVNDGKTSPNLFEGIEHEGVMKIAKLVAKKVHELHNRRISLHEAKQVIDTSTYKLRGQSHDFSEYIEEIKKDYLKGLLALIESRYGNILDKCDFISLSGGGSYIFASTNDGFIRVPKSHNEHFNAIGFYLFGCTRV